jgi:mono/diheme cytochrome c family protein
MSKPGSFLALALLALLALGCGEREEAAAPAAPAPTAPEAPAASAPEAPAAPATGAAPAAAATEEATQIFATRCTTCHGPEGQGDGPGSAALDPKPRNFQDPAWQDSVTDEHIANIILYGGAAVGRSPTMPGNPDLIAKPEVVRALAAHVRSLARR